MSDIVTLEVSPRSVTGKKVSNLRTQGIIPAVVYGPTRTETLHVQIPWTELRGVLRQAGGTEMISLKYNNESINALIREVQRHPTRGNVLHVDFYAVDVTRLIRTHISIMLVGEESAAKRLATNIVQPLNMIEVESFPNKIPPHIELDLAALKRAGDHLTVANLPQIEGVTYLHEADAIVAQAIAITDAVEDLDAPVEMGEVEVIGRRKDKEDFEDEG